MKLAELGSIVQSILPQPNFVERRKHRRIYGHSLSLTIEGKRYETLDWSLGGFRIADFHRPLAPCQQLAGTVIGHSGVRDGEFTAAIVRTTVGGEVGCRWLDISCVTLMSMANIKAH
jgi:hypothetical protein